MTSSIIQILAPPHTSNSSRPVAPAATLSASNQSDVCSNSYGVLGLVHYADLLKFAADTRHTRTDGSVVMDASERYPDS